MNGREEYNIRHKRHKGKLLSMEAEATGGFDRLAKNAREGYFTENVTAKGIATASRRFVEYLRNERFHEYFKSHKPKEETRNSIDTYRYKTKDPAYVVKAGVGIPGSLNYLAGLYRGQAVSRSGKVFDYKGGARPMLEESWKAWGGKGTLEAITLEVLEKMIAEAEKK